MKLQLTHGDSRTLTFTELADAAGVVLPNFQAGDAVRFTLRRSLSSAFALLGKTTDDAGIAYTPNSATGQVNIGPTDWDDAAMPQGAVTHNLYGCVWDLQRTRAGFVLTVLSGTLDVLADVTR